MDKLSRREFIGATIAATGIAGTGALIGHEFFGTGTPKPGLEAPEPVLIDRSIKSPADRVRLGKSGLRMSVIGIGTGTVGWNHQSNQTRLGQEGFTRLMRHAFDSGLNFFDLADQYGSNPYFARAMKGVPRDQYLIQTKTNSRDPKDARQDIDRFLSELGTDHIDSLIVHCVTEADWTTRYRGVMDVFEEAKRQGKIRSHGVTCHDFRALQAAEASDWVEVNQVRWNPRAAHMDADVETARSLFRKMRSKGQGMIGMKVVGQGDLVNGRKKALSPEECIRFQIESGVVDAFVLGVESTQHIDQALHGTQLALNELGYRAVNVV
ncbi:MAG TPA: aldo/keto reductase [Blastocatellia bacterium]|nr:aldo/keto reductase [Blastocatellia bacterium]